MQKIIPHLWFDKEAKEAAGLVNFDPSWDRDAAGRIDDVRPLMAGIPVELERMLQDPDSEKAARVTETFLKLKKLNIAKLEEAYNHG